jgi:acyl phosphate:glycerol-3-phosphate acyltransferase
VPPFPSGWPTLPLGVSLALLALGWACGSFPSAVVVGRAVGIDVLRDGEGNPGSANVWHLAGPMAGMAVLLLDLLRAIVPGLVGWAVGGYWGAVFGALGAVIGSVRPLVPGLRGGRGVGTAAGAGLVIEPVAGIVGFAAAIVAYAIVRRAPVATAVGFVAYPVAWLVLGVRSIDTLIPMAGAGLIALVAAARWAATRSRAARRSRA